MDIKTVGVVGAGTMGHGIAQVLARHGYSVVLQDVSAKNLQRGVEWISRSLSREVEKGHMADEDRLQTLDRVKTTTAAGPLSSVDCVIEAVNETFEAKAAVFRSLDRDCRPETILATNTSSISITRLAAVVRRPAQFVGLHFFNPVPVMKLVEIVPGLQTSPETVAAVEALAASLGKTPVEVEDFPGFISNRVLMPMINEAVFALMEGVADAHGIDTVMKLGMNHPMGPPSSPTSSGSMCA